MAACRLTHRNETAQKAANGKTRPILVNRDLTVERPLRSNSGRSDKTVFWELPTDHVMRD
jgi:hypothetical protein